MTFTRTDFTPMTRAKLGSVHMRYDADHECTRWSLHTSEEMFQAAMKLISVRLQKQPRGMPYPLDGDMDEDCWGWASCDGYSVHASSADGDFMVTVLVWPTGPFLDFPEGRADPRTWVLAARVIRDIIDFRHLLDAALTIN